MDKLLTLTLKSGESVIFKTNMPKEEVQALPTFANQHKLNSYFKSRGYELKINIIIKK